MLAKTIKDYFKTVDILLRTYHQPLGILAFKQSWGSLKSCKYTRICKVRIAQYAARNGVSAALIYFKNNGSFPELK